MMLSFTINIFSVLVWLLLLWQNTMAIGNLGRKGASLAYRFQSLVSGLKEAKKLKQRP